MTSDAVIIIIEDGRYNKIHILVLISSDDKQLIYPSKKVNFMPPTVVSNLRAGDVVYVGAEITQKYNQPCQQSAYWYVKIQSRFCLTAFQDR